MDTTVERADPFGLDLPPDLLRQVRIEAASSETDMSAVARKAVETFLPKRKASGK